MPPAPEISPLLLNYFNINGELDCLTHHAVGIVGTNAKILAVDGRRGRKPRMRLLIHSRHGRAGTFDVELDRTRDAVEGEVPGYLEVHAVLGNLGAGKGGGGELGHVEEVRALHIVVARADPGVFRGHVDG